jgi:sporulation protein YlmC with PRC-barrel domain
MKQAVLTAVAVAFGLAVSVHGVEAQDKVRDVKDRAAFTWEAGHVDAKKVVGMKVNTPDGKHVGEIDQLIVDVKDGKVSHAVVGLGGVAGVGEQRVVVPWSQVKIRTDRNDRDERVATIDRAALDSAKRYTGEGKDRGPAASPATAPAADRDRDGATNRVDRAPNNPNKK